ncbi:MAG: hypothetical protein CBE14_001385 [Rickettsiales bacterium TMED254]|nr:MAG: hypothetical protein CBE14_001385 [Rickettsiales bacterium TMED254]
MTINKIPQNAFSNDDMVVNVFTATANQTAFTLTKKVSLNSVLVHVNDVIQQPTADYTINASPNNNILTFTSGATVGDDVRVRILSENPLGVAGGGGSGISLSQARAGISVTTASASGGGSLSYNNTSGVLTFAPSTNSGGGGSGIALTDLSVGSEGSALGNGAIAYNNSTGVFTYTPPLLNGLTANGTTNFGSNKITYSNNYANLADLPSASTYHGMFAHVHAVGAGYYAHAGNWVRIAEYTQLKTNLASLDDVSSTAPSSGQVLKWSGSEWAPAADATGGGGGGIALTDLSVGSEGTTSGDGAIAYNSSTGVFTYTPPVIPSVALPDEQEFGVTASGSSAYTFSGAVTGNNPTLNLQKGKTYRFDVNASGHPFQIRVSNGGSAYTNGVENNGAQNGSVYFTVPFDAPDTLVYQCTNHAAMVGTINCEGLVIGSVTNAEAGRSPPLRNLSVIGSDTSSSGYKDIVEFLEPNTTGGTVSVNFGVANSLNNLGKVDFTYAGAGSATNRVNIGFHSNDNKLMVYANGEVELINGQKLNAEGATIQTTHMNSNTQSSANPVNVWAEVSSDYRIAITPKYVDSYILATYHIPMNPTGASNILMAIAPWASTNGGTTQSLLAQGTAPGTRHNLAASWFRSNNGYDGNDMQNHVVHFRHDHNTTSTLTYGFQFRSEGANTTYFCRSNSTSSTWGWVAPIYMELREIR